MTDSGQASAAGGATRPRYARTRTAAATVLILLASILAPTAVVTAWARASLTDTDAFVATYAPLAQDPDVRSFLIARTTAAINDRVNPDALTRQVVDGIIGLGTGPRATAALRALQGVAAEAVRSAITDAVRTTIESPTFATTFETVLRGTHTQLVATMSDQPDALITAGDDGTVRVQVGPIVARVKVLLQERGIGLADRIPTVNRSVAITTVEALPQLQLGYGLVLGLGAWLPWLVLLLFVAAAVIAVRRSRAILWAGIGLALGALGLLAGLWAGQRVLLGAVASTSVPAGVLGTVYDTAAAEMRQTEVAVAVLAGCLVVVTWLVGPFRSSAGLRRLGEAGVTALRSAGDRHGVGTGRFGAALWRARTVVLSGIAVVAGLVVAFARPLTVELVLGTLAVAAIAAVLVVLFERPQPRS